MKNVQASRLPVAAALLADLPSIDTGIRIDPAKKSNFQPGFRLCLGKQRQKFGRNEEVSTKSAVFYHSKIDIHTVLAVKFGFQVVFTRKIFFLQQ